MCIKRDLTLTFQPTLVSESVRGQSNRLNVLEIILNINRYVKCDETLEDGKTMLLHLSKSQKQLSYVPKRKHKVVIKI